ncbi:MAG: RraA family protein, partial [Calditrichales bacterium]
MTPQDMLSKLEQFDTPAITNVVASYPEDPLCLQIFDPWKDHWYTDHTLRCMYPELRRTAGFAVTCVYGLPEETDTLSFADVAAALEQTAKPYILVIKQQFPPEIAGKVGLSGGNMTSAMKAMGCVGVISNGPSRDIDEIRPMKIQYMLTGASAGHGPMAVKQINQPVMVAGMSVSPGDIIHMDENGACKFPADKLNAVLHNVQIHSKLDKQRIQA